tara:strand:+ start:7661 stop:8803 length:1143 start_codon:yes stop_codon:yes gene_type:complete
MNKRIAIVDPIGAHGSSHHFYLFGQSNGLIQNGCSVNLYTNKETEDPKIDGLNFFTFYNDIFSSKFKIINGLMWIIGSSSSILHARFSNIRIFHFHIFYTNILVLFNLFLVKLLFGKVVLTIHDVDSFAKKEYKWISSLIYLISDLVLTHNKFSMFHITKKNPNLNTHIEIIPHGNYNTFINVRTDKIASRVHLGLDKSKKVILFFGMIKRVKGLDILLEAFKKVIDKNPDIILLIAGKTWENDFSIYQKIINQNNLNNNIVLHNKFIPQNDVEHYYCASDLVVLPYTKIYQSGVLMMALSYERPVLVSDLPPLKEVIIDNENGFLFKSENINDLSTKLNFILSSSERLEKVRKNGSFLIKKKYDWNILGRLTLDAYQNI